MIVSDRREPDRYKQQTDASLELPVGDYWILSRDEDLKFLQQLEGLTVKELRDVLDPFLIYERKLVSDFWRSIQSNRMNLQVDGVDGVLIEFAYIPKKLDWERIYDAMNGLAHHAPVFHVRTPMHLFRLLRRYEKQLKDGSYFQMEMRADIVDHRSPQLTILAQFPGIGMKRAESIMAVYSTLDNALRQLDKWSEDVDGVGPKTVDTIHSMLASRKW